MPVKASEYPPTWAAFSREIRYGRAGGRCECTGECGLHQPDPQPRRCLEMNHRAAKFHGGNVWLSVAHLCDCYPICTNPEHVKAMCQRCHLRFDRFRHAATRLRSQAAPGYKAQRYRRRAKELGFDQLAELTNVPARKKTPFWFPSTKK